MEGLKEISKYQIKKREQRFWRKIAMLRFIYLETIDGFYSAAVFESIARHVGSARAPETIFFWRVRSPVVYLGYHQCVEDEVHADYCADNNIGIVRRILGGGCGFCNKDQILYSIIAREDGFIPRDIHDAYQKVLGGVVNALTALGARDARIDTARNAVYTQGRKISGNAQGRLDGAVLVNGSLLLDFDFEMMDRVLKNPTKNLRPVTFARDGMITLRQMGITDIDAVRKAFRHGFEEALGINSCDGELTASERELADILLERYLRNDWIYKMDNKRALRKKRSIKNLRSSVMVP